MKQIQIPVAAEFQEHSIQGLGRRRDGVLSLSASISLPCLGRNIWSTLPPRCRHAAAPAPAGATRRHRPDEQSSKAAGMAGRLIRADPGRSGRSRLTRAAASRRRPLAQKERQEEMALPLLPLRWLASERQVKTTGYYATR